MFGDYRAAFILVSMENVRDRVYREIMQMFYVHFVSAS